MNRLSLFLLSACFLLGDFNVWASALNASGSTLTSKQDLRSSKCDADDKGDRIATVNYDSTGTPLVCRQVRATSEQVQQQQQ